MVDWLKTKGYSWAIDENGKINDIVLMALIIAGEFSGFRTGDKNPEWQNMYDQALGALSNQYHANYGENGNYSNIQCGGNCTFGEQVAWLTAVES